MDKQEEKTIREAFELLEQYGVYMSVPGWFDLSDAEDAIEFCRDRDSYYEKRNPDYSRG